MGDAVNYFVEYVIDGDAYLYDTNGIVPREGETVILGALPIKRVVSVTYRIGSTGTTHGTEAVTVVSVDLEAWFPRG